LFLTPGFRELQLHMAELLQLQAKTAKCWELTEEKRTRREARPRSRKGRKRHAS
jgi:hypothetical protein